ncbi:MAG: hypothetical protein ACLS8R_06340 [Anaeromassilibacillus sp.]
MRQAGRWPHDRHGAHSQPPDDKPAAGARQRARDPLPMEIMGGETSTNADEIAVSRTGVPTAMVSIPLRYMHTPVEVIDTQDVAYTARLLAEYVKGVD